MNKQQRKLLAGISERLSVHTACLKEVRESLATVSQDVDSLRDGVETIREEEQQKYDSMPEGLQDSDKGYGILEAVNALDIILDGLDQALGIMDLSEAEARLEEAVNELKDV